MIVIGYRVRDELARCLDSIFDHAGVPVELTYVDNASRDGSVEWVREAFPAVHVIELERNLFGSARNRALGEGRGRYTLFIDSDAVLLPATLPTMVEALDRHPNWGLIGPRLQYPGGELQFSCRRFPPRSLPIRRRPPLRFALERSGAVRHHLMEEVDHTQTRPVLYVLGACQLFRSCLTDTLGGLDPAFGWGGEDIDWCIRTWESGSEVVYLPAVSVDHDYRRRSSSAPLSGTAVRHLQSFVRLQWKYRGRLAEFADFCERLDTRAGDRSTGRFRRPLLLGDESARVSGR